MTGGDGATSVSGLASVASSTSGLDTPEAIELRKRLGVESPSEAPMQMRKELFTVIEQKEVCCVRHVVVRLVFILFKHLFLWMSAVSCGRRFIRVFAYVCAAW